MTDRRPDLPAEDNDDLLAAEYVLGVLDDAERRAAAARAQTDGAFAARVRAWEGRLAPLNAAYPDAPVPDLLPAIEARLFPSASASPFPSGARGGFAPWRWLAGVATGGVLVLGLAVGLTLWRGLPDPVAPPGVPVPAPVILAADLNAEGLVFAARYDGAVLEVARSGAPAGDDADYQLWLIDDSGVPRALGLLRDPVTRLTADLDAGLTLAVSLEPPGGSPEPLPTGPVLAAAALTAL